MYSFRRNIDHTYLDEVYGGERDIIIMMMGVFLSDSVPSWESVGSLLANNDLVAAGQVVHRIKPSFTMVGLQDFHEPVQALEHALKQGVASSIIRDLHSLIDEELALIIPQIEAYLSEQA
ncbi:Hpt domain-containing protein [Flectobacillus sp. DC10W]|jgi:HPt (histidine-containing phosphotransfer) domain-containing protein|uniref:Hpt domain-containing protein n=1 Tax=Flectobacillus longus TaxID=2984207 RepID=A0ABT6YTL7_9BACT|nr:Hpt domain-containing protein [Flectobacillus longus]MDI9866911.1 Hpt domain-containing protein [Flectobacillus longus]